MSIYKTQGLQLAIASAFGTTKNMTAISNATEGVATLEASHGIAVADIFEVLTSGWKRLAGRVVRAKTVATNDVTLEGINTSSTADYPATEGVGTIREITTWTPITQLLPDFSVSGGGFRRTEVTEMDDIRVKELILLAEPVNLSFSGHYDPALPWINAVLTAARSGLAYPYRMTLPGGAKIYGSGTWGFNPEPQPNNGVLTYSLELATVADSVFYAS